MNHVAAARVGLVLAVLAAWEALSRSGLLYRDVVPSLVDVGAAIVALFASAELYVHLGWTVMEVAAALGAGTISGVFVGVAIGASSFLTRSYRPYLYYFGATPKLIFFPIMIMWFGVGPSSKIALAAVTCFFPVALSTLAGVRDINPVFIRVGRSFRASLWQMAWKVYLPALRQPILTGVKLGLGLAVVVTLLAETKLSNRGLGFLVIQAFNGFDMPRMYALLIAVFVLAIGANVVMGRAATEARLS